MVYTIQMQMPDGRLLDLTREHAHACEAEGKAARLEYESPVGTVIKIFEDGRLYAELKSKGAH